MKKQLVSIAAGAALLMPTLPANAACIHVNEDLSVELHTPECLSTPGQIVNGILAGGCRFAAVTDVIAGSGTMAGEIDVDAVVFSANLADNPVSATVTCYIKVNGATQAGAVVSSSGTVVVVGGGGITYLSASVDDFVQLCQDVSYSNGVNTSECFEADRSEIPPPIVSEVVDPYACAVLRLLAGTSGPGGVVRVENDGDVSASGEVVHDCSPYGSGTPQDSLWVDFAQRVEVPPVVDVDT